MKTTFSEGGVVKHSFDISLIIFHSRDGADVERAIRSCLSQTTPGQAVQIILISSVSDDVIKNAVTNYNQYLEFYQVEGGSLSHHMAMAAQHMKGRHILFLDSDDYMSDYMVLTQHIYLFDHADSRGVSVDYWAIKPGTDKKVERVRDRSREGISGIMWRRQTITKHLHEAHLEEKVFDSEMELKLCELVEKDHLPIAFFRKTKTVKE